MHPSSKTYKVWTFRTSLCLTLCAMLMTVVMASCKEKKEPEEIIIEKVVDKPQPEEQEMSDEKLDGGFEWIGGASYTYTILRKPSSALRKVKNHDVTYTDNEITLVVKRADGTVFFEKKFTKANFAPALPKQFNDNGVLLGMNFEKAAGNNLNFVVSVGSPDDSYDEFFYVFMTLDNYGNTKATVYKN